MFYYWKRYLLILLLFLPFLGQAQSLRAIPELNAPVMDTAQMMSAEKRNQLNQQLLDYSNNLGSQIAVLTVDKIQPESPFDYASRVFDSWKLGRKNVDDGVLLLIVRDERKTHIAVGSGLEGAIPDAYAKRILSEIIAPNFRAGDVDGGIIQAVEQIQKLIAGEKLPSSSLEAGEELPPSSLEHDEGSLEDDEDFGGLALVFVVFGSLIVGGFSGIKRATIVGGGGFGFVGLLFGKTFVEILQLMIAGVFIISVYYFTLIASFRGGGGRSSGGGGGGFSGGGGGSSGGGASGGW